MKLDTPVQYIKGVGPSAAKSLSNLGISTIFELVDHYPRDYKDYSIVTPINDIQPGPITVKGRFSSVKGRYVRKGLHITEALMSDQSGSLRVTWFNQPYRANQLKTDQDYYLSGNYDFGRGRYQVASPSVEVSSDFTKNTARIVPIYKETKGLKSSSIRKFIAEVADSVHSLPDTLPKRVISDNSLMSKSDAVWQIHFPDSTQSLVEARKRLAFEELFELQLAAQLNKQDNLRLKATKIPFSESSAKEFVASLPFKLTDAQRKSAWEIFQDFDFRAPMNRLVEGDVGSGKTVVAAFAVYMAKKGGFQSAVMAPTELLAKQHLESFVSLLKPLGIAVKLLTATTKSEELLQQIADGEVDLIIGTHALIQDKVVFKNLNLAVIDEQHRFGVNQRQALKKKAKHLPHLLAMTATPIPRSLALTLYGELEISIIDELPKGRKVVATKSLPSRQRQDVFDEIEKQINLGHQAFIVCPNIDADEGWSSAEYVFEQLTEKYFTNHYIELIHGKIKSDKQELIMNNFKTGKTNILVATTVVEVGVDIPNATVMVIESADRFGLAQLHQLRGRVGRSDLHSQAFAISENPAVGKRLKMFAGSNDGFELSKYDLETRGAGAIFGTRQSGDLDLRIAKISDYEMIEAVQKATKRYVKDGLYNEQSLIFDRVEELRKVTKYN